jgi:four helix bundle protein
MSQHEEVAVKDFRKLIVYQKSLVLVDRIYQITDGLPPKEEYRLTSQIIRAATSISANIAESEQIYVKKRFSFLNNAVGSVNEVRCWLDISLRKNYINQTTYDELEDQAVQILKMLLKILKNISSSKE